MNATIQKELGGGGGGGGGGKQDDDDDGQGQTHHRGRRRRDRRNKDTRPASEQQHHQVDNNNTPSSTTAQQHEQLIATLRDSQFLRQVSDQSRFMGIKVVVERGEKEITVEKTLLLVAQAHRVGVLSLIEKQRLKDILFAHGCRATLEALQKYPGGSQLVAGYRRQDMERPLSSSDESTCHTFTTSGGYTLRITTRDHNLLAMALRGHDVVIDYEKPRKLLTTVSHMFILSHTKTYEGLSKDTTMVLGTPNAGGNSIQSEALSFEVLQTLFGACNVIPECAVKYDSHHCSIVDYVCDTAPPTSKIGVSVTRALALAWPGPHAISIEDLVSLIDRKLRGLDRAREHVVEEHVWKPCGQLLHIWVQTEEVLNKVRDALSMYEFVSPSHVLLTLCPHLDHVVFGNEDRYEVPDGQAFTMERQVLQKKDSRTFEELIQKGKSKTDALERAMRRLTTHASSSGVGSDSPV